MGNFGLSLPYVLACSAWTLAQLGESSEALSRARESKKLAEPLAARGAVVISSLTYFALGRACLALGRLDEAQHQANRARELFPGHEGYAPYVLYLLGDIATHPTASTPRAARTTTARRWRLPSRAVCARS
jgi:Flp pilus assembly protein TadD